MSSRRSSSVRSSSSSSARRRSRYSVAGDAAASEAQIDTEVHSEAVQSESESHSHVSFGSVDSPTRLARLDEKTELADLNKRLEFYILRQRERDASSDGVAREVEAVRAKAAQDLQHAKQLYEGQLAVLKRGREEAGEQLRALEQQIKRREIELKESKAREQQWETLRGQLEARLSASAGSLVEAQSAAAQLNNENSALRAELEAIARRAKEHEKAVESARSQGQRAQGDLSALQSAHSDLQADYESLKSRSRGEIDRLRAQIELLHQERNKDESTLEREFESKLLRLFSERQAKMEADKEAGMKELKVSYDEKIYGYRSSLEQIGHELEAERANNKRLNFVVQEQADTIAALEKERNALANRVEMLERQLDAEKQNPELLRIIAEKQEIIKRIKASFKRKDQEFDELMDVKIMLDMEIKAYRSMIEAEEERLGYNQAAKKRKRDLTLPVEILNENLSPIEENRRIEESWEDDPDLAMPKYSGASLVISGMDLEGEYITIRNNSTATAHLAGWKIQARETGKYLQFPTIKLGPGEGITVITKPAEKGRRKPVVGADGIEQHPTHGPVLRWIDGTIWSGAGDQALLIHPHGDIIAAADILPSEGEAQIEGRPNFQGSASGQMEMAEGQQSGSSAPQNCSIM